MVPRSFLLFVLRTWRPLWSSVYHVYLINVVRHIFLHIIFRRASRRPGPSRFGIREERRPRVRSDPLMLFEFWFLPCSVWLVWTISLQCSTRLLYTKEKSKVEDRLKSKWHPNNSGSLFQGHHENVTHFVMLKKYCELAKLYSPFGKGNNSLV